MGKIFISHSSKDKNTHSFKYLSVFVSIQDFLIFKSLWEWESSLGSLLMLGNLDLILIYLVGLGGYE
jgi:hypothetical protein